MSPLLPILGLAAAAFFVLRKSGPEASSTTPTSAELDRMNGIVTAYAYLDSEPKKDVEIEVNLKALAGTPLGLTRVTPRDVPMAGEFPDGRKGRMMLGSFGGKTGGDGPPMGAMLYFV